MKKISDSHYSILGKILFLLAISFSQISCQNDNSGNKPEFEGSIKYLVSAKAGKNSRFTDAGMQDTFGDTMIYYYKRGKYRMSFNGKDLREVYYFTDENNEYTLRANFDTLFYFTCSKELDKFKELKHTRDADSVNGFNCNRIEIVGEKFRRIYYYSNEFYLDPSNFKNYVSGDLNKYFNEAKAPYLKYVYEGKAFETIYTAIEIKQQALHDSVFSKPSLPVKQW